MSSLSDHKKITVQTLRKKKERHDAIVMLTAYDYPMALAADRAGVDAILVGDSLGMVVLGYENTLAVTMEDMLHHCKAVARGATRAHLVGDMPFMSYQAKREDAIGNAGRFLQEAGMHAVKLEGGREMATTVESIASSGIPVMGHIGLTPQYVHQIGGWKTQGKTRESALRLVEDARILEDAGCYALVLEAIPDRVAELITKRSRIPTIGIGAGNGCDGQVLVVHDMLGMYDKFTPTFVKRYAEFHREALGAISRYRDDVTSRRFPAEEHSQAMDDVEYQALLTDLGITQSSLK
jgi:3-methyl-2-oxobutanoate hydroxymethyltransferase